MVESISSVPEQNAYAERVRPPEPQVERRPPPGPAGIGGGDVTPPNNIALLNNQAGAELLRVQETLNEYKSSDEFRNDADRNQDNKISRDELQKVLEEKLGEEEAAKLSRAADRLYERLDRDADEAVTTQELADARAAERNRPSPETQEVKRALGGYESADALVAAADTNEDKVLERAEVEKLLAEKLGEQRAGELSGEVNRLYERTDADRNNQLTADELQQSRRQARAINIGA